MDVSKDIKDVDLVITTLEVEQMLNEDGLQGLDSVTINDERHNFDSFVDAIKVNDSVSHGTKGKLSLNYGSGSGGHAENVLVMAAQDLFSKTLDINSLNLRTLKNSDFKEITLESDTGEVLLRFAIANGFRNIQNIVQKMKRKKCAYDLIEVMACPSGCLNGGAQCKPSSDQESSTTRSFIVEMEKIYKSQDNQLKLLPGKNPFVKRIYSDWLGGANTEKALHYLRTEYHEVEKMTNTLAIKW